MLLISLVSCIDEDEMPLPLFEEQVARLLSADTSKSWLLSDRFEEGMEVTLASCEQDNLLVFFGSDTVNLISGSEVCPDQPDSIIFQARWFVIENNRQPFFDSLGLVFDQVVGFEIDSVKDQNGMLVSIDTVKITEPDTSLYVIERITSQFLTLSFPTNGLIITEQYEVSTIE